MPRSLQSRRRGHGFIACIAVVGAFVIENHCSLPVFEAQSRFDHLGLAHYYLRAQLPDRALTEAVRALREDADTVAPLLVMARAYHQKGETEEAVESLTQAIRLDPDDGSLYMLLHRVCIEGGRPALAIDALERLFTSSSANWNARVALGWAYESADSTDSERAARGLEFLEEAVAEPGDASDHALAFARHQLAKSYLLRDRFEDAAQVLESSLEFDPGDRFALFTLGEFRLQQDRAEEAEHLFERLMRETDDAAAASRIAGLWYDAGHRQRAIQYYEWAMQVESPPASLMNNLAWTYAEANTALERARELSLRAVKEEADNVVYLDTYAEVLYRQGHQNQALALIRRAIELETDDGEHRDYLLRQLKRFTAAAGFIAPDQPTSTQ